MFYSYYICHAPRFSTPLGSLVCMSLYILIVKLKIVRITMDRYTVSFLNERYDGRYRDRCVDAGRAERLPVVLACCRGIGVERVAYSFWHDHRNFCFGIKCEDI